MLVLEINAYTSNLFKNLNMTKPLNKIILENCTPNLWQFDTSNL